MDNQDLQESVATIPETLITTQRNLVTISRSLWAVRTRYGNCTQTLKRCT
jgi:hypothetical protein